MLVLVGVGTIQWDHRIALETELARVVAHDQAPSIQSLSGVPRQSTRAGVRGDRQSQLDYVES